MSDESNKVPPEKSIKKGLQSLNSTVNFNVFTPDAVAKSRMAICRNCEFLTSANFCRKCKCMMNIKTRIAAVKCPEGKWHSFDVQMFAKK